MMTKLDCCVRRTWLTVAFTMAVSAGVTAHDFWIEASNFNPAVGDSVRLHLRVGEHFAGEAVARNDS
jgi:uncharacterized GH25 family protein